MANPEHIKNYITETFDTEEIPQIIDDLIVCFGLLDEAFYILLKWAVTIPSILGGQLLDLAFCGVPKRLIDVSYCMQSNFFFRELTRAKEKEYAASKDDKCCSCWYALTEEGFSGLARAVTSYLLEIPFSISAVALALVFTAVYFIVANTIGKPVYAIGECVINNMSGNHQ